MLRRLAFLAIVPFLIACSSAGEDTPEQFLRKVQASLNQRDRLAYVQSSMESTDGVRTGRIGSWETWVDVPNKSLRSEFTKDPSASYDMADRATTLLVDREVFSQDPDFPDEDVGRLTLDDVPACYEGEPDLVVVMLLCPFGFFGTDSSSARVEGESARGDGTRSLVIESPETTTHIVVDAKTYRPIVTIVEPKTGGGAPFQVRTTFQVDTVASDSVPPDFFDPRALGYVPIDEQWLAILDDPALGVPVYWPGRSLSAAGVDAPLTEVDDRRPASMPPGKSGPGQSLTLAYVGNGGRLRLDYWTAGQWEGFVQVLGQGFAWANCSDRRTVSNGNVEIIIYRGFEASAQRLPVPQVAPAPQVGPGSTPFTPESRFLDGCPERDYDLFMAEVRVPGGTITLNAPYGLCCQDGKDFGAFDAEAALEDIARQIRPRQPGE